jgi:hypothetical protein
VPEAWTNRDLYRAVSELTATQRDNPRGLEEYLRALGALAREFRDRPALAVDDFVRLLAAAFTATAPPFDESWRPRYGEGREQQGFWGWEATLRDQVVDLREMAESGVLGNDLRYFGVNSPRGRRWYNFDPCTYLECATAGSYGGWRPGDDTGRDYVPGPVAVMREDGQIRSCDPRDVPDPVVPIPVVSWDDFRCFLNQGQYYE